MDKLIEALKALQGEQSFTEFAMSMNIPPQTLQRIFAGNRGMGTDVLLKVLAKHPELAALLTPEGSEPEPITS